MTPEQRCMCQSARQLMRRFYADAANERAYEGWRRERATSAKKSSGAPSGCRPEARVRHDNHTASPS